MPFLWSDAVNANLIIFAAGMLEKTVKGQRTISAPTENGKKMLTDAENMSKVREAGRV